MKNKIIALIIATIIGICVAAYLAMKPVDKAWENDSNDKEENIEVITPNRVDEMIKESGDLVGDYKSTSIVVEENSKIPKGIISYLKIYPKDSKILVSRSGNILNDESGNLTPQIEAFETLIYDYIGGKKIKIGTLKPTLLDGIPVIKGQGFDYYIYSVENKGKKYIVMHESYDDPKGGENYRETVFLMDKKILKKELIAEMGTDTTQLGKVEEFMINGKDGVDKKEIETALSKYGLEGSFFAEWKDGKNIINIKGEKLAGLNCHMGKIFIDRKLDKDFISLYEKNKKINIKSSSKSESKLKNNDFRDGQEIKLDDAISIKIPEEISRYARAELYQYDDTKSVVFYSKEHDAKIKRDGIILSIELKDNDLSDSPIPVIVFGTIEVNGKIKYVTGIKPSDVPVQDQSIESTKIFEKNYNAVMDIINSKDIIIPSKGVNYKKR